MFVGWTPYGKSTIEGIQGRYFIPVISLLFMCFNNKLIYGEYLTFHEMIINSIDKADINISSNDNCYKITVVFSELPPKVVIDALYETYVFRC